MKIDRLFSVAAKPGRRGERSGAGKAEGFSKALGSGAPAPTSSVSGAGPVGPVDALLALQEVGDEAGGQGQARRRAEDLLDRLDELRLALLAGRLPRAVLERLSALVASRRSQVSDPRLAEVLDEIELRAAVELAKLDR